VEDYKKKRILQEKMCVVLMPDTGWRELVEARWNMLADENNLVEKVLTESRIAYPHGMYGDGNVGEKIITIIFNYFN
jgi:UDP-N-acetylglucosamine 2-epimerase (non-hydrolysing)